MAEQRFDIWKKRWEALDATIKDFLQDQAPLAHQLKSLVERFQIFGDHQFNFFFDGFGPQENHRLVRSREFPPEYVFAVTLDQIASDLEVLRRVADQRIKGADVLAKADKLAWAALKPMVGSDRFQLVKDTNSTVMTYFQKSADTRIIPYAPVALIGLPFSIRHVAQDYLVIPHEVGHYVYRRGKVVDEDGILRPIPRVLSRKMLEGGCPKWMREWREELFADVYGCLIGGPVIALSGQDLALQSSITPIPEAVGVLFYGKFTEDNGEHPAPALRPYIYTKVLKEMGVQSAAALEERWDNILAERKVTHFKPEDDYLNEYIPIDEARVMIDRAIGGILKLLPDLKSGVSFRWSGHPERPIEELYAKFEHDIPSLIANIDVPDTLEADSPDALAGLWENWIKAEKFFPGFGAPPLADVTEIEPGRAGDLQDLEQEPRYTWMHVFQAAGWTTKLDGNHGSGIIIPEELRADEKEKVYRV